MVSKSFKVKFMVTPDTIIRTNRRSLSLTIAKDGKLVVRAPKRLSMDYIYSFIKQKEKWILNKQREIQCSKQNNKELINYKKFMFCGKEYEKIEINKLKDIEISNDNIFVPANIDCQKLTVLMLKWYSKLTKDIIKNRLPYFINLMQVELTAVKIDNSKAKWGSCDSKGVIKFNLRLAMLPHKVIDYILIHELSHLVEFNHSKNFYAIIESVKPDYKKYRAQLKDLSFLLQLLR